MNIGRDGDDDTSDDKDDDGYGGGGCHGEKSGVFDSQALLLIIASLHAQNDVAKNETDHNLARTVPPRLRKCSPCLLPCSIVHPHKHALDAHQHGFL